MHNILIGKENKKKRTIVVVHGFFPSFFILTRKQKEKNLKDRRMRIRRSEYTKKVYQFEFEV